MATLIQPTKPRPIPAGATVFTHQGKQVKLNVETDTRHVRRPLADE